MIRIDNISFEFTAPNEKFAHELYADWDDFCHSSFEQVVEECLSAYDKEKVLYEIEQLELDLGSIPEKDFYQVFPGRLKEELLKVLPTWDLQRETGIEKEGGSSRLDNLLFCLEYGYPKAEWADEDFRLSKELDWLLSLSASEQYIIRIARLCLDKEHVFRRLLWQTDDANILLRIYVASLAESSVGQYVKHRFLARLLEAKPGIPVRFVHEATDDTSLQDMAELLDSVSVRQIMMVEAEEHAEVNLPPYWHYLYEWLIRYYPYNGIAIFGGKAEFTNHLHHRLLTFIRKRNYSFYLSKAELTVSFLLEVFGPDYYIGVLNAIYYLQPCLTDGSPVYDGYFNKELYRIFLQLSLLHRPTVTKEGTSSVEDKASFGLKNTADFMDVLQDTKCSDAEKRMFIRTLIKEQPEMLIKWLRSNTNLDTTKIAIVATLTEADTMNCMLAALSFSALQAVELIRNYLWQQFSEESDWLKGTTEAQLELLLRQSVLQWVRKGNDRQIDRIDRLLIQIYQELTGKEDETIVARLSASLPLQEIKDRQRIEQYRKMYIIDLLLLFKMSGSKDLIHKKLVLFLEQSSDDYTKAIRELYEYNLLEKCLPLISQPIWEEVLRQSTIRLAGTENAALLLSLFDGLMAHERTLSSYLHGKTKSLKIRLLTWLIKTIQPQETHKKSISEYISSLFVDLFDNNDISKTILPLWQEMEQTDYPVAEEVLHLLVDNEYRQTLLMKTNYNKWQRQAENDSNAVQTLFKSRWSTVDGYIEWLNDASIPKENKSGLLQHAVTEHPDLWICLLRDLPHESQSVETIAKYVPAPLMLQGMTKTDFYQASVLSQLMEQLQQQEKELSRLVGCNLFLPLSLSKVLLLYLQDQDTSGRTLTAKEIIEKFLAIFYFTHTGKTDYRNNTLWISFSDKITSDMSGNEKDTTSGNIINTLSEATSSDMVIRQSVNTLMADSKLPENTRRRWLRNYMRFQPKELLEYIQKTVSQNILSPDKWIAWLDTEDWLHLAASFSLSGAELFRQILEHLSKKSTIQKSELRQTLATYIIKSRTDEWIYGSPEETIRSWVQSLPEKEEAVKEEWLLQLCKALQPSIDERAQTTEAVEYLQVENAGLCLLAPWFSRLFDMLGYLDDERKSLRNTALKIRAVFLLQYIVYGEEREYRETELVFNRLLVGLSQHIPIPKHLPLTDIEKQTADSMVAGIKANWQRMKGTSVKGFRQSFIARNGKLEQQEERWLLTIEEKAYDILLESIPWGFRQIRLPWLKKYIQVMWQEKQKLQ